MVHSLRKYLSNRGSALFMVLSTMTALMITCMAMYFAVVSSRSAGFAVFNQQQSYQSAISIAEMTVADLSAILSNSGVDINSVEVGKTFLTTDGNGFKTLNPGASNADDHYLGAYDVTMTRLANEKIGNEEYFTVDIAVTTSVSGVKEVYHQVVNIIQENGTPDRKGKIFASTGYVPNDSFLSKGRFFSDVYVSNEDTVLGAFEKSELHFFQDIFCENSLTVLDNATPQNYKKTSITHAVRGDYNIGKGSTSLGFNGGSYIFVGKDMHLSRGMSVSGGNLEVYILGNLYLEPGAINLGSTSLRFYVAGDVIINQPIDDINKMPGVIYCHEIRDKEKQPKYDKILEKMSGEDSTFKEIKDWKTTNKVGNMSYSFEEAIKILEQKTPDIKYKLWQLDESKLSGAIGTTQADGTIDGGTKKTLNFKSINNQNAYRPITLSYEEDGPGCIIQDIYLDRKEDKNGNLLEGFTRDGGTEDGKMPTLIIDTGDDPSNTYVIRLQANNQYTYKDSANKDVTVNYFSWRPKTSSGLAKYPIQVLVKGNGSVVIDVPEGVVYQDSSSCHIMHYNWYMLGDTSSGIAYETENNVPIMYYKNSQGIQGNIYEYVHSSCDDDCGCKIKYTTKKASDKCAYCGSDVTYTVTCSMHGEYTICPKCDVEYFDSEGKPDKDKIVGLCKDRVEKIECINKLEAIDSAAKPVNRDKNGNIIVPNCNIYLISCSESAAFRFGRTIDDKSTIEMNCFMGFIYAPYMSYKANGNGGGGEYYMHVGGMVVSDYKFLSLNRFVACWPSVYPPENVLDQDSLSSTLNPVSEKRYRVQLKAAY